MDLVASMASFTPAETVVLAAYLAVMALLSISGVHRLELMLRARRAARREAPGTGELPFVTIQLPIMNERYVAERLIRSAAAVDYPRDRLEIQVLDDSTDDTVLVAERVCAELRSQGLAVDHVRRETRAGFKAGALAAGLARARGEVLLILDADFVLPREFLARAVPHFADASVGMVQARWGFLNRGQSLLTEAQAMMLDGHFSIEHRARHATGRFFNFNGTAGLFRKAAIEAAGGWQADTLTEDLDLSYRVQLAGSRGVYLDDLVVPSELPASIGALKSQQHRWAKGSLETCRKLLPAIWRSGAPLASKVEATFHLADNVNYLLLLVLSLLSFPALAIRQSRGEDGLMALDLLFFLCGTVTLAAFYGVASRATLGSPRLSRLPLLMALGIGLAVNNSLAVVGGLLGVRSPFVRTPKRGESCASDLRTGYRPRRDLLFVVEIALGAWASLALAYAVSERVFLAVPFLALFACGYLAVGFASAREVLGSTGRASVGGPVR
ncbi:MAG: glycosyltransferase [Acidobacteriota bacterium]